MPINENEITKEMIENLKQVAGGISYTVDKLCIAVCGDKYHKM